jgi:hypothetical protein
MKVWSIVVIQGEIEWTAFITDDCEGLWVRFWVSLPVPEVGQVALPLASKAPGFDGVPDSFQTRFTYPLPSRFSPPRKTKHLIIIENSYYYININCY